jgi:hypothetical protein
LDFLKCKRPRLIFGVAAHATINVRFHLSVNALAVG